MENWAAAGQAIDESASLVSLLPSKLPMNSKRHRFSFFVGLYFLSVYLLFSACNTSKVDTAENNTAQVEAYMEKGLDAFDSSDFDLAQSYFDSAHLLLGPKTDTGTRIKLLFNQTEILKLKGDYDTCLTNYYEAARLAKSTNDTARIGLALYNIAAVNFYLGQLDKCREHADSALNLYIAIDSEGKIANCYTLIAIVMRQQKNPEGIDFLRLALKYYKKAGENRNIGICYSNMGNYYYDQAEYPVAANFYKRSVDIAANSKDDYNLAISCGNLGDVYTDMGLFEQARFYIDSSMRMSKRLESKESIEVNYTRLTRYFDAKGDKDSALIMMEELLNARTERLNMEGKVLIKSLEENHQSQISLVESKANVAELHAEQAQSRLRFWFLLLIGVLLLVAAAIFIRKQMQIRAIDRNLHEKEKAALESEKSLNELLVKQQEADQIRLEKELEFKRQELVKFSLAITERENFVQSLRELFGKFKTDDTQKSEVLREIKLLLYNGQDEGKTEIFRQIDEINHSFVFELKSRFPKLNEEDIRLASLLLLDLSSKEIADMLSIEAKSVDMKRYRLKKKFDLDSDTDLKTFLHSI